MEHSIVHRKTKRAELGSRKKSHWLVNRKVWQALVKVAITIWRLTKLLEKISSYF